MADIYIYIYLHIKKNSRRELILGHQPEYLQSTAPAADLLRLRRLKYSIPAGVDACWQAVLPGLAGQNVCATNAWNCAPDQKTVGWLAAD